ncbi:MAG: glutamate synthase central domain-containing protein, partial [Candidatus Promineifilaceae bacterium]
NWMRARETLLDSPLFGSDLAKVLPIIHEDGSDSAMFDNCLEFLVLSGRSLPHAVMMMIPEPWSKHESMSPEKRAFYEYHSCLMDPWDGPASIAFTDGVQVGAVLDRNGLRPARYTVTKDGLVVMASEAGVLDIPADRVLYKGRLQPGRMLLVDTAEEQIISDEQLKQQIAAAQPYQQWLDNNLMLLGGLPSSETPGVPETAGVSPSFLTQRGKGQVEVVPFVDSEQWTTPSLVKRQQAFGYTFEDLRIILSPMAQNGVEPLGSMGNDTPLAVLSNQSQLLYNYFKQLFAQVTNPPIDAIREALITGTEILLGSEGNLLSPDETSCRRIKLQSPILTNKELYQLRSLFADDSLIKGVLDHPTEPVPDHLQQAFKAATLPMLFPINSSGVGDLAAVLKELFQSAEAAINEGANLLILSDRGIDRGNAAIPALLATAGLHHHLIRSGLRTKVSLIVESGEPREVHHFATLLGYGADAINPYLAFESLANLIQKQLLIGITYEEAVYMYVKATVKGVVKVISKMGISTLQSYQGAQIFEALGLHPDVVDEYFTGTPSR